MAAIDPYSLEDAERDIAALRGQVDRLTEVLTKNDSTDPPANPAAGLIHYSLGGHHKYASSDGTDYNSGRLTLLNTSPPQTISVTTDTVINGLQAPVAAGVTYAFRGILRLKQGGVNTNQKMGFTGPAVSFVTWFYDTGNQGQPSGGPPIAVGALATQAIAFSAINNELYIRFEGAATFSANGTFAAGAAEGTFGNTFTILAGCIVDMCPVT